MQNQLLYAGVIVMTVACFYLMYQNYQLKKNLKSLRIENLKTNKEENNNPILKTENIKSLKGNDDELVDKNNIDFNNIENLEENLNTSEQTDIPYNLLKTQYDNYTNSEQYDSYSEDRFNSDELEADLKDQIENLEKTQFTKNNEELAQDNEELAQDNEEFAQDNEELAENDELLEVNEELPQDNEELLEVNEELPQDNEELNNNEELLEVNEELNNNDELLEVNEELNNNDELLEVNEELNNNDELLEVNEELNNNDELLEVNDELNNNKDLANIEDLDNNTDIKELNNIDDIGKNNIEQYIEIETNNKEGSYKKYTKEELENMTVKQLQQIARDNKIKVKGRKDELISRFISQII